MHGPQNGSNFESGQPREINAAGQVIGISERYSSTGANEGEAGWLFDPATNKTYPLVFSVNSSGYSDSFPWALTSTGGILGDYELYSGSVDEGAHAFYWSETNGFSDLGGLVNGGLGAQGWQELSFIANDNGAAPDSSPLFIDGFGLLTGQSAGQTAFLLANSVPEPGSSVLLSGVTIYLALRRRRHL